MNHATQSKVKILYREVRGSRFEVRGSRFEVRGSRILKALRLTLQGFFVPIGGSLPRAGVSC